MVRISKTAPAAAFLGLAIVSLAWAGFALAKPTATSPKTACGTVRWAVKTLSDPAGRRLSLKAKPTTIRKLRRAKAPRKLGVRRTKGIERTTFRVTAKLVQVKTADNGDIQLVIADPKTGGTMIAAFPSASCTRGAKLKARVKMAQARAQFLAACGEPSATSKPLSGAALITGVGFFDPIRDQEGAAPNGLELHPVVGFSASSCSSVPGPPPPPSGDCSPSYPDVCIPPPPPHLKCSDIVYRNFRVLWDVPHPDPHHFDKDRDGIGCET